MRYISCGQASIDCVSKYDGTQIGTFLGGPGVFGYTGLRLWHDDSAVILNIADDFYDYYGDWIKKCSVNTEAFRTVYDKTHTTLLVYDEEGIYKSGFSVENAWLSREFEYAWTNTRIEQIERFSKDCRALYIYIEPTYKRFWKDLGELSCRRGFETMWEIGIMIGANYSRAYIRECLKILKPEMASLNFAESRDFFGVETKERAIEELNKLDIPYFFFRAGSEGSYGLYQGKAYFVPSIDIEGLPFADPTGCGNTSTAAATYSWVNTKNPVMTGIMANIAAGCNVAYKGIIDDFSKERREQIKRLAVEYYNGYISDNPGYAALGYAASGEEIIARLD